MLRPSTVSRSSSATSTRSGRCRSRRSGELKTCTHSCAIGKSVLPCGPKTTRRRRLDYAGALEPARFVVRSAPAALLAARVALPAPARRRAPAIEQLRIAEHRAFLVELAQLRRIELDEHASRMDHVGIELDGDAAFAHH